MLIGYARVSKDKDQDTALQLRALKEARVEKVLTESASGGRWDRPELHKMLAQARSEGRIGGRRPKLTPQQEQEILESTPAPSPALCNASVRGKS